jgi:hypothetical protein
MTAAWIEYEIREPGEPRRIIRRAVFDLIGAASRSAGAPAQLALDDAKRLTRSLALMIRTEILPITSRMAPEYVTHLTAEAVVANGKLLRSIAQADRSHVPETDSLLAQAAAPVSTLYALAAARFEWSPVGNRVYVDRLGLLTSHRHPAVTGDGFGIRGAIDVAAGEVGVSLAEPDAFEVRLRQGVLETNAEALWWQGATVLNAGEAYKTARDWATLTEARRSEVSELHLPADARTRITRDLDSGFVVIAPKAPVPSGSERFIGWWRIDPATGTARGVAGNGWGQCQEYATLIGSALIRGAAGFAFEYGLCQGIAQGINAVRREAADLQARGVWFGWVGSIESKDASTVFREAHEGCLISAMMSGVLATLPIILKFRQLRKMQALEARAAANRAPPQFQRPRAIKRGPKVAEPPPPRSPKFVQEKEAAHRQAQRATRDAMQDYFKAREGGQNAARDQKLYDRIRAKARADMEAFKDLLEARREAEELARSPGGVGGSLPMPPGNNNVTITDLNREFATELIEVGFGGVLGGK